MSRSRNRTAFWIQASLLLPLTAGVAASLTGFATMTPGTTMFSHDRGVMEGPGEAPSDGEYILHQKFGDLTPLKTCQLRKGDRLGFKTAETGRIIAVAGDSEWTYEDAALVWKRKD